MLRCLTFDLHRFIASSGIREPLGKVLLKFRVFRMGFRIREASQHNLVGRSFVMSS